MIRETVLLSPTEHLPRKNTIPRLGDKADLHSMQKQKHKCSRNMETKKHASNERTREIPRKKLNEVEASNLPDTEFKIIIIKILKERRNG